MIYCTYQRFEQHIKLHFICSFISVFCLDECLWSWYIHIDSISMDVHYIYSTHAVRFITFEQKARKNDSNFLLVVSKIKLKYESVSTRSLNLEMVFMFTVQYAFEIYNKYSDWMPIRRLHSPNIPQKVSSSSDQIAYIRKVSQFDMFFCQNSTCQTVCCMIINFRYIRIVEPKVTCWSTCGLGCCGFFYFGFLLDK